MMRRRTRPAPLLTPVQQQRLDGWLTMLDVDLELAQKMLRLPPARMPVPPIALPPVLDEWSGAVLAPAVEAPDPDEPAPAPRPAVGLRGAYARRARQKGQGS